MSTPTRFKELQYEMQAVGLWRILDATGEKPAVVGPQYRTKAELLADLERFAAEFGCEGASAVKDVDGTPVSKLNGIAVSRVNRTIFIPLPRELWVPCGGCSCAYCSDQERVSNPIAFWDTLAVSTQDADRHTWTVHAPELHGATLKR